MANHPARFLTPLPPIPARDWPKLNTTFRLLQLRPSCAFKSSNKTWMSVELSCSKTATA